MTEIRDAMRSIADDDTHIGVLFKPAVENVSQLKSFQALKVKQFRVGKREEYLNKRPLVDSSQEISSEEEEPEFSQMY